MLKPPTTGKQTTLDWLQIGAVLGLMIIGVLAIYSATLVNETAVTMPWYRQRFFMQIVWGLIGTGSAALLCLVDYHVLARWSLVGYWGTILLLVAVLIPHIGTTHGWGARRWIDLGPAQLQPSEFAKVSFIFAMAHFLSRPPDELREPAVFWKALGMIGLPFALIMKEPDLGSALIFPAMGLLMLFAAGAPLSYLRRLVGGVGIVIALILVDIMFAPPNWQIKLEEYQRRRLLVYFGRDFAPRNASPEEKARLRKEQRDHSYNVEQALISVGSGGLFGRGWFQGKQAALGYLPKAVAHNDFIFSVIAEEKGFMGSVVVITLYSVVLFTGLRTASQARDRLGKLLAVGVVAMLFSHVFINIGMNIRMMPVTGVPLPLLSYGGSSVLCSLIAIGIMQNVHLHRRAY
jgi:rod shape determining protein RodA